MIPALAEKIREMAALANPSETKMAEVLAGWDRYFQQLNVPPEGQLAEFDAIIRARVQAGSISIVAYDPTTLFHEERG